MALEKSLSSPIDLIRTCYMDLSSAERKVADWVMAHPSEVAPAPISETARSAGVSEATVVRFCRSLGYKGYLEFKFRLTYSLLGNPAQAVHDAIRPGDSTEQIVHKVFASGIAALHYTLTLLDVDALSQAVEVIGAARQILVVGVGTSTPFALDLMNTLIRLGLNCMATADPCLQLTKIALMDAGDVVIAISHSGASADPVNALRRARERGVCTIAITGCAPSPITRYADVVLLCGARETRPEPLIARLAQLAISDAIYMALAMQDLDATNAKERNIWELILDKVTDA